MDVIRRTFPAVLAASAMLAFAAAGAFGADAASPAQAFAARGPLALSFAAEPGSTHFAVETGWPLFAGRSVSGDREVLPAGAAAFPGRPDPRVRLEAMVLASSEHGSASRTSNTLIYTAVLDRQVGRTSSWLGISTSGADAASRPQERLRLATGLARAFSGVRAEAAVVSSTVYFHDDPRWTRTSHYLFQPNPDSSSVWRDTSVTEFAGHLSHWTTAQGALRWQRGRWAMETVGGVSLGLGVGPRRWAQGVVRVQLSRRVLALASVGERPSPSLAFDGAAQPRSMVGVQFAPWSTPQWEMAHALHPVMLRWKTEPAGTNSIVIRVHCRDTQRVEVAGDFTDWRSMVLMPLHGGWWAARVHVDPGPHRVQIRLDGGMWCAPSGLPRAEGGPAGEAATLVVP